MTEYKLSESVIKFVVACRARMQQDSEYAQVSDKARVKLILLLNEILRNKDNRKEVLQAITGIEMPEWSQSKLTLHTHCVLIEAIEGPQSRKERLYDNEIREIEHAVSHFAKTGLGLFKIGTFPNGTVPTGMSDMFTEYKGAQFEL